MMQINWFKKYTENFDLIESTLKQTELWSNLHPSDEAMESTMPFAVDTMSFENWLQFIFLPKMRQFIETKQLPPGPAQILPIAEETYKENSKAKPLLDALKKFDEISYLSHTH